MHMCMLASIPGVEFEDETTPDVDTGVGDGLTSSVAVYIVWTKETRKINWQTRTFDWLKRLNWHHYLYYQYYHHYLYCHHYHHYLYYHYYHQYLYYHHYHYYHQYHYYHHYHH